MDDCKHEVPWGPVETEYKPDGTAFVWQEGFCKKCGSLIQLNYEPGPSQALNE